MFEVFKVSSVENNTKNLIRIVTKTNKKRLKISNFGNYLPDFEAILISKP